MRGRLLGLAVLALLLAAAGTGLSRLRKPSDAPAGREVLARGAALYRAKCQACHGGAEGGRKADIPPPHNRNGHTWHHTDCQIEEIVLQGFDPGDGTPPMPAFRGKLSQEDVRAILAHVKTWWTVEQRKGQARLTRERC